MAKQPTESKLVRVISEKTNYNQIGYQFTVECTEEQRDQLAALGATILSQRSPAATADKVLGYAKGNPKAERADYEKAHGVKWQRNMVAYSDSNAQAFADILRSELGNAKHKPFAFNLVDVQVYVNSSEGAMQEAIRAIKLQQKLGKAAVAGFATALGFSNDETTELGPDNAEFVAHVAAQLKQA